MAKLVRCQATQQPDISILRVEPHDTDRCAVDYGKLIATKDRLVLPCKFWQKQAVSLATFGGASELGQFLSIRTYLVTRVLGRTFRNLSEHVTDSKCMEAITV